MISLLYVGPLIYNGTKYEHKFENYLYTVHNFTDEIDALLHINSITAFILVAKSK